MLWNSCAENDMMEKRCGKFKICRSNTFLDGDEEACVSTIEMRGGTRKMIREDVLMLFVQSVKRILKDSLSKLIVYGSYARGDYKNNSDIDVMILTSLSKEKIEQVENAIFDLAFDLELETGIVVNPVIENEAHYRYWLGALPFYNNVEKEGIVIG